MSSGFERTFMVATSILHREKALMLKGPTCAKMVTSDTTSSMKLFAITSAKILDGVRIVPR
eukprot:CAMPEP_0183434324 /NCGR_PEP_ID=MMETSP0370-20130417/62530_1 /TAXON_ID=268820 /ORGANISM="Peridinium aciculiferum, Strain PAER-2" /LENGTH=60 /DNA_ID=CAMNT_0025620941 /DNA_START=303 /DNA_END=482 /DNA_ORIENTATION=+